DDGPVLVVGETGVGKEHVARLVHDHSPRRDAPFVAVNCAALPADLLEAELFGIARGVATGVDARPGRFAEADGGSLLLDELGEMPPALQSKLLRVLERGEVQPLGGALRRLDVRVIGATNIDLESRIAEGSFRADLYYRLALHVLDVPPLRARRDDIPLFIESFLRDVAHTSGRRPRGLTVAALDRLCASPWPGNVRQLQHEVRRLVFACPDDEPIDSSLLSASVRAETLDVTDNVAGNLTEQVDALERRLIRNALDAAGGVLTRAAEALGLHRNSLTHKMRRLGIERPGDTHHG
ncbi:MAG: sigma 54-interacting transcriptional regulator, partial [Acidobacteriota bacterium]